MTVSYWIHERRSEAPPRRVDVEAAFPPGVGDKVDVGLNTYTVVDVTWLDLEMSGAWVTLK
ncbi:hypothetical protein SEA_LOZINAK_154 [Gordonia phage Lozinak]|uniref:Uncharacterized protein n=3 Tax=Smoothievirus TaxID=1982557 RepID=A0A2D1GGD0_9CAUD|nr:hypothetical protein BH768_gp052 [Gordonia phage ClubL]YP_009276268.1 hypothetical protein BH772_gp054 [Gordonia phage Bachita]YP_009281307.1 hypothetical protein BIZ74_gp052 [Gordonia phage Cucurbita]ATN90780.1 hypothetical protein SEA_LOZINAK_154 [Gordonia phage Lozinak]AUE23660.1 hypothetical protein SEA_TONIANN_154 [Gordonia phage Toniann]QYC53636.1 hypothetical protein SEA_NORVS_152 [Gordonia phage Norvs]WKW85950.1 hypothetical protein SEA_PHINKBODEN_152 [Gordonia Phage PhinkBoden]AN